MQFSRSRPNKPTSWLGFLVVSSLAIFGSLSLGDENEQSIFEQANVPLEEARLKELLQKAASREREFKWDDACAIYESILRADRNLADVRAKHLNAVRRSWQARRQVDDSFRKDVLSLDYGQSVRLYNSVIETLLDNSLDGKDKTYGSLLQKGVEELSLALADRNFVKEHIPSFVQAEVGEFRELLRKKWGSANPGSRTQLTKQVREIALAAQARLQLNPAVAVMELAAGACYAFDEYTAYLTPNQLREVHDSLKGEFGSVLGISLMAQDGKVLIADVSLKSPAGLQDPPLKMNDQVLSINRKAVTGLTVEAAMEMFSGPPGTSVDLEIISPTLGLRTITLPRQVVSTVYSEMRGVVGYIHISSFQETTLQDVDEALMNLNKSNMKALVLDLRQNSGGLFDVAVEVARRFLAQGVVVSTQNSRGTTILHARNPGALGVPLVIIVDSDTASSAEVLAGTLKDNKRGRLIGETTFGKGCAQSIFRLPNSSSGTATGGLRITVARFFSPEGVPYTGRGVLPHIVVERMMPESSMRDPHLIDEAVLEAQRLIGS